MGRGLIFAGKGNRRRVLLSKTLNKRNWIENVLVRTVSSS